MAEQLNKMQQDAVDFPHTEPAVVTAAAGSGKTTLLVQRIIRLLSDPTLEIKADTMAIMTFTRNATNILREKLNNALNERLDKLSADPDSQTEREWLSNQIFALRQASISTIDAFCQKIIRENPESFDLAVNFTIADAPKRAAMRNSAISAAMQDFYNDNADNPFTKKQRDTLFFTFDFEDDNALREAIIKTDEKISAYADADAWLDGAVNAYKDLPSAERQYIGTYTDLIGYYARKMKYHLDVYDEINDELTRFVADNLPGADNKSKKGLETIRDEVIPSFRNYADYDKRRFELVTDKLTALKENPGLAALTDLIVSLQGFEIPPEVVKTTKGTSNPYKQVFTTTKNGFKETVNAIINLPVDEDLEKLSFPAQRDAVNAFIKLLRLYRGYYAEVKKSSGCVDFSDCELMLLEKLNNEEFREQIAGRFSCIIVDEFQDSNDIQAEIFRKIGKGRLFYVGDVKQAIYAFRGGNPEIMARLCGGEDGFTPLPLNRNYRSRSTVIDTVNHAFTGLMTSEYGGVEYAGKNGINKLVLGKEFPETPNPSIYNSEIHIVEVTDDDYEKMAQARFVARRIKELHDDPNFLVTKNGELVRPSYSDFIILSRTKTKFENYRMALRELGIGAVVPKGKNLLDTEEIRMVLSFLRVVDNPMRNDELLNVMMSPIFRFTAEEMGKIRLGTMGLPDDFPEDKLNKVAAAMKKYSLYRCAQLCAEPLELGDFIAGETAVTEREISPKLIQFLEKIRVFRDLKSASSVYRLIRRIYEETDLIYVVSAFEDSASRVANIRQLLEIAADFEERDGGGLSDFLRFLERVSESLSGGSVDEASRPEEQNDSVSIMTFHASKGLEAPVCVMAELQSKFNDDDYTGTLLISRDNFLALKYTDIKKRVKRGTMAYNALSREIRKKQCGEELRLLYVAMTRAQEKLIMVGQIGKSKLIPTVKIETFPEGFFDGSVPFKWVLTQLMSYYDADSESFDGIPCELNFDEISAAAPEKLETETAEFDISEDEVNKLCAIMSRGYKYDTDTRQQSKFTVTQLAHIDDKTPVILTSPSFIERAPTGAERGNAYHHCMEFFPIEEIRRAKPSDYTKIVESALDEITGKRLITRRERDIINVDNIVRFFNSELGQRMLKSELVRREEPFYAEINGETLGLDYSGDLSIQGRIDMYFVENGELVIVDYKSDSVTNLEKEKENYAQQVSIYGQVLPKLKGMPVRAIYLYAFTNGEAIEIQ